jgi:peroxiredoxin
MCRYSCRWWIAGLMVALLCGCGEQTSIPVGPVKVPAKSSYGNYGNYGNYGTYGQPADPKLVQFNDNPQPSPPPAVPLKDLSFVDVDGKPFELKQYLGKKNVVLVVSRGYTSSGVCVYCSTHTSRFVTNYDKFAQREAEVVTVFPVDQGDGKEQLQDFLAATRAKLAAEDAKAVPFPVVLDLRLKAVNSLNLKEDVSKPATYILDKKGNVQFAHVGTLIDRPSVKALLEKLDTLK